MNSGIDTENETQYPQYSIRLIRFLTGFLLAVALFLFEVGISEIVLTNDATCREAAQSSKLLEDPYAACLSEMMQYFFIVLSRGPFAIIGKEIPSGFAWFIAGGLYGVVGGFLGEFSIRMAISVYLVFHALTLIFMTFMAFLSSYIV